MTPEELGWLAGWLEGEGTFYFTNSKSSPTVVIQVYSVDLDVIEKGAPLMGGRVHIVKPSGKGKQLGYRIHLESLPAVELMERLLPFMGKRRTAQIEFAIARWHSRPNKPVDKLCACGCGRPVFGRPRILYARRETGACAMQAFRARQRLEAA